MSGGGQKIPLLDLRRELPRYRQDAVQAVERVLEKGACDRDQLLGEIRRVLVGAVTRRGARRASAEP